MDSCKDVLIDVRAEDFVEYYLFFEDIPISSSPESLEKLKRIQKEVEKFVEEGAKNYIWQKDNFNVILRNVSDIAAIPEYKEVVPPHLFGTIHYGDNIEDEWFVVHLLVQLTNKIPGLIARVVDTDGEFLLIEAADHLPSWASPEVCDKRVYIYKGEVHLIPLEDEEENTVSVVDCLNKIKKNARKTRASTSVQEAINTRIKGYPEKVFELLHQTNAYVPAAVAALLNAKPNLIAPAVTAFCHRDPIDMKVCRAMRYFPPETRVMSQVKMTRCLYAMLLHHKFVPDRRTGWHLPPSTSPQHLPHSIGVKLACGFEILVSQVRSNATDTDLSNDGGWLRYKQSLTDKGYFKGLLEGCLEYNRLENNGKEYYRSSQLYSEKRIGEAVLELLDTLDVDIDAMRKAERSLPPPDDDSWMEISEQELDKMLGETYGISDPAQIPGKLSTFLDHISGLDGAEHPPQSLLNKDGVPLRPKRVIKKGNDEQQVSAPNEESNRISFDQEAFSCAIQNILDFVVPEDSWDLESEGSGMSAYEDEVEMDLSRKKSGRRNEERGGNEGDEIKQYMDQMDRELANTTMAKSFHKKKLTTTKGMEDSFSDIESFEPVDIDMNALKNILESYEAEGASPGPATNLLGLKLKNNIADPN